MLIQQFYFWQTGQGLDAKILNLLPDSHSHALEQKAIEATLGQHDSNVLVLLGHSDWQTLKGILPSWQMSLHDQGSNLVEISNTAQTDLAGFQREYLPWQNRLMTEKDRLRLANAESESLVQEALVRLYQPFNVPGGLSWTQDPLGLFGNWLEQLSDLSHVRNRDSLSWVAFDEMHWVALSYRDSTLETGLQMTGDTQYVDGLQAAFAHISSTTPGLKMWITGVPLYAERAAQRAKSEASLIGVGSFVLVLGLMILVFRSVLPVTLISISLFIGLLCGLAVTTLLYGRVHLMTLVFGATLIGVAEDYGIHWFAARQKFQGETGLAIRKRLSHSLFLAFITSAIAYAILGLNPLPGLQQMAVFSIAGMAGAYLTVVCWFPLIRHSNLTIGPFSRRLGATLGRMPRVSSHSIWTWATAVVFFVALIGILQLKFDDSIRNLRSQDELLEPFQQQISQAMGSFDASRFFLVSAASAEELLQTEELLKTKLAGADSGMALTKWMAVSDALPSQARQVENQARYEAVVSSISKPLIEQTGHHWATQVGLSSEPLTYEKWQHFASSIWLKPLWLGAEDGLYSSVVRVPILNQAEDWGRLEAIASEMEGVRWVDTIRNYDQILGQYRGLMQLLLVLAHVLTSLFLWRRVGSEFWRVCLPVSLGTAITVGLMGWLGLPLHLLSVLSLIVLLGLGVDYGIFLLEHQGDESAWMAVLVGAFSTAASLGLLALSSTPALSGFGSSLFIGLSLLLILVPMFRKAESGRNQGELSV